MSKLSLDQTQLKQTVREMMLEIFAENSEYFYQSFSKIIENKSDQKLIEFELDLEESANLYAEIYQESKELQELTESALLDFVE